MSALGIGLVVRLIDGATLPFADIPPCCVLLELTSGRAGTALRDGIEECLAECLEAGVVTDAVIAESEAQRAALWRLREEHTEAQARAGASVKNDVSVPVSRVPVFLREATEAMDALMPGIRVAPFGHLGDGNIHFNLVAPEGMAAEGFLAHANMLMDAVAQVVLRHDGSFSAEHGVGALKTYLMKEWRGGAELDLMRRIKRAIDPDERLNPGKLLPDT
jgi:FAD/FMN-containing dehydrogenase